MPTYYALMRIDGIVPFDAEGPKAALDWIEARVMTTSDTTIVTDNEQYEMREATLNFIGRDRELLHPSNAMLDNLDWGKLFPN
jgi:hypothetical protein